MNFEQLIQNMPEETYLKLKHAVEIGKWADGISLTAAQKEHSLQAVIAYQTLHQNDDCLPVNANGKVQLKATACASTSTVTNTIDIKSSFPDA